MEKLGPESTALCHLLMGHIDQKRSENAHEGDLLRGHLDGQIHRMDLQTKETKTAQTQESEAVRTLIRRNQEYTDARLVALELCNGAQSSAGGGSAAASLAGGQSVCHASGNESTYRPFPNRSCDGFPLPCGRNTFYFGGFPSDSSGERIVISIKALIAKWKRSETLVLKTTAAGMHSGGRVEMTTTQAM